jgi:hypothetical protein
MSAASDNPAANSTGATYRVVAVLTLRTEYYGVINVA